MKSYEVIVTDEKIDDLLEQCWKAENDGTTKYRNETYEAGIKAALCWAFQLGYDNYHPLND